MRSFIKHILFRPGIRPRRLIGGELKGFHFQLDLRADTQVWRGIYEQQLQAWLLKNTPSGAACLDIGAADGYFSLLMAKLAGPKGIVYAFEPSERGNHIAGNFELNANQPLAKIETHRAFVGRETTGDQRHIAMDEFFSRAGARQPSVVKIDVDGGEIEVLEGMKETLSARKPALSVEVHSHKLLDEVLKICFDQGYKVEVCDPPPHEHRPIEYNPTVFALHK